MAAVLNPHPTLRGNGFLEKYQLGWSLLGEKLTDI